jgi:hypothetical protein
MYYWKFVKSARIQEAPFFWYLNNVNNKKCIKTVSEDINKVYK